jgi:hypothetical protein
MCKQETLAIDIRLQMSDYQFRPTDLQVGLHVVGTQNDSTSKPSPHVHSAQTLLFGSEGIKRELEIECLVIKHSIRNQRNDQCIIINAS